YLPNQFLADSSNHRNDDYGGSVENRNRFVLEVMQEMYSPRNSKTMKRIIFDFWGNEDKSIQ
ncbi:MAG: hypothetical protein ACKOX0_01220, partial [Bacteroidota bacterium]